MDWQRILYLLPGLLLGLTIHECCHALCAWRLGDDTAREQGRVSLNPLRHIDPLGFLFIVLAGFGWAKPVVFDPARLGSPRRDRALIALAGPLSNLALGILLSLALRAALGAGFASIPAAALNLAYSAAAINFVLFVFNMLPIPPLDGSHVVFTALGLRPEVEAALARIGMPALVLILLAQNLAGVSILPVGRMVGAMLGFFLGG
jgi:Zn-dependent protease